MAASMPVAHEKTSPATETTDNGFSNRPIDLVHLAHYTHGDAALEQEILQLFRVQSRIYLERLRDADRKGTWREAAHTIKGSARSVGAWQIAEYAETLEKDCDLGDHKTVAALEKAINEVNAFIKTLLANH